VTVQRCVFVGGAPLTGKSTLGHSISADEGAVLLATDAIRDWMQSVLRPDERPDLFFGRGLSPDALHERHPQPGDLLAAQLRQGIEVQRGITGLLRTRYLSWNRIVIEGVALTPAYMVKLRQQLPGVAVELIVLHHSADSLNERLQARGLWTPGGDGSQAEARREQTWLELFDRYFCEEAKAQSLPLTSA
jgi:2-phosphoglycerate kinase